MPFSFRQKVCWLLFYMLQSVIFQDSHPSKYPYNISDSSRSPAILRAAVAPCPCKCKCVLLSAAQVALHTVHTPARVVMVTPSSAAPINRGVTREPCQMFHILHRMLLKIGIALHQTRMGYFVEFHLIPACQW